MPMTFEEAETKFRQLQGRVQRGESISRAEYEEEVGKLAVQDRNGTLWEINPRTGKWMYFDGAEWVSGAPPGHDTSTVMPVPKDILGAKETSPAAPTPSPALPAAPGGATTARGVTAPSEPPPFVRAEQKPKQRSRPRASAAPPPGTAPDGRPSRSGLLGGRNREWVPLAIGAVVLLFCAVCLLVSANIVLPLLSPKPTPTRTLAAALTTSTKVPTPMLLPSPTPIPPTPVPVTAKAPDGANVRDKPSTKGAILTKLAKNAQVTLIAVGPADGANVWYQVNVPDKPGPAWIRSDTLQIIGGDPKTLPVAGTATPTPTKGAAVPPAPAGPTATFTPIGVIPPTPKAYP